MAFFFSHILSIKVHKVICSSVLPSVEPLCYEIFVTAQEQWPGMPIAIPGGPLPQRLPGTELLVPQ